MVYKQDNKLKCLKCGFWLFLEKNKGPLDCPKCRAVYTIGEEDGETFLEEA